MAASKSLEPGTLLRSEALSAFLTSVDLEKQHSNLRAQISQLRAKKLAFLHKGSDFPSLPVRFVFGIVPFLRSIVQVR